MSQYTRFPVEETRESDAVVRRPSSYSRAGAAQVDVAAESAPDPETRQVGKTPATRQALNASTGSAIAITLFLVSLVIPVQVFLGSLLLNPTRLFLLIVFVPVFVKWASGEAGKTFGLDFVFLGYVLWMGITLFLAHGATVIDLVGITTVETLGAFLVGRVFVRSPAEFERLMKVLALIMLALVPAAVLESLTGIRVFSEIADAIGRTHNWVHAGGTYEKRLGMYRAHTVFEHPILFGVFSASVFSLLYFTKRKNGEGIQGYRQSWLSFAGVFFSLSSGAILALATQMGLTLWDWAMRGFAKHWKTLLILVAIAYVIVDLLSNRTPMEVFISYAAFSAHNGYIRIVIFTYGMETVWANPLFGIGQADWVRPSWLRATSVDNFWLLMGMRHGFPGFILIAWAFLGTILRLTALELYSPHLRSMRYAMVFSLIGLVLALMTVHIWGVTYIFVCFLLGAGVWMRDYPDEEMAGNTGATDETQPAAKRGQPAQKQKSE